MKKMIALLAVTAILCCGCQNKSISKSEVEKEQQSESQVLGNTQEAVKQSPVTAEDYYRYLKEVRLDGSDPSGRVASNEPIETSYSGNTVALSDAGGTGLVSALIEDFNGDGVLEMLTVELTQPAIMDTFLKRVRFEDGEPYNSEYRCLSLFLRQYIYEDGEIKEYATGSMNMLPSAHFGNMYIGIEKVENQYYLFSQMTSENLSTYGPNMDTVCQIGGDNLNPGYIAPFEFWRGNRTNYLELMGMENKINPAELSVHDVEMPTYGRTAETIRQTLGNRVLCVIDINESRTDFLHQITDYTNLRENLENNGANWKHIQLPEGYYRELPKASDGVEQIAKQIEDDAGCRFGEPVVEVEDGISVVTLQSEKGNKLTLRWNHDRDVLLAATVNGIKAKPDEEWYAIKDALLKRVLNLSEEDQRIFLGDNLDWNKYVNGIQLGDYTLRVFAITQAVFSASLNSN